MAILQTENLTKSFGALTAVNGVSLRIEARDADGAPVELELEGLAARVAQHEVDHLDGILIVDRTTPEGRREALAVLRQATQL